MASSQSRKFPGNLPFSYYLLGVLCLLIICIIFSIIMVNSQGSVENQKRQQQMTMDQTEAEIIRTITLIDSGRKLGEEAYYPSMVSVTDEALLLYQSGGSRIRPGSLEEILNQTGSQMDISFVNRRGIIESSTRPNLEGKNASQVFALISQLDEPDLWNDSFTLKRAFRDHDSGEVSITSTKPTLDKNFLVFVTLTNPQLIRDWEILNYSRSMKEIISSHPAIINVQLFSSDGKFIAGTKNQTQDDLKQDVFRKIVGTKSNLDIEIKDKGLISRYLYIDLGETEYSGTRDVIAEITLDSGRSAGHFQSLWVSNLLAGIVLFILSVLVLIPLVHALTHPLRQITDDVDTIARGDLEHPIRDTQGRELSILKESISSMVDTLRATIHNLRESEDLYREVVESQNELICRRTYDGTCIFANAAFCRYYKKTCDEIIGKKFFPETPGNTESLHAQIIHMLSPEKPSLHLHHRVIVHNGIVRWHSCQVRGFFSIDGTLTETQEVCQDISERIEFENALKESEGRFRNLIEKSPINIAILRAGEIVYANPALGSLLGYEADGSPVGSSFLTFIPEEQRKTLAERNSMRNAGAPVPNEYETLVTRIDGSMFHCHVLVSEIELSDGPATIAYLTDITRRKVAEEEVSTLYADMEQKVRVRTAELSRANKELESFSYSVSHDLKSPLRAIDGYSSILSQKYATQLPDDAKIYLTKIRQNTLYMADLINDVLELSRIGRVSLKKERIDIGKIVREVIDEFSSDITDKNVSVKIAQMPPCTADPLLVHLVYSNLISNALKFSRNRAHPLIEFGSYSKDGQVVYFVKDNGIGFDMKYADTLFKVFTRLHNTAEYEGTGIGLAIVSRIIEKHGGKIWVDAEPSVGATFFFTFGPEPG